RFALAVLVAYAMFFAVSAGTARTAGIILGVIGAIIAVQIVASVANVEIDLLGKLQAGILNWPGPLAVFAGRLMLVDVQSRAVARFPGRPGHRRRAFPAPRPQPGTAI